MERGHIGRAAERGRFLARVRCAATLASRSSRRAIASLLLVGLGGARSLSAIAGRLPSGDARSLIAGGRLPALRPGAPLVGCTGGGILFWWQAGAISAIREQCNVDHANFVGASAGSLTAVLAANGVSMDDAFDHAITLSKRRQLFERPLGLAGVWGDVVEEWLHDLLPSDAARRTNGRVGILMLRTLPYPRRVMRTHFSDRSDLIQCALASCHIPYFMNGRFSARYGGGRWIDGSFLSSRRDLHAPDGTMPLLMLDPACDPSAPRDFLRLRQPQGVRDILDSGKAWARSPLVLPTVAQLAAALEACPLGEPPY
jgi:hypothetical protein